MNIRQSKPVRAVLFALISVGFSGCASISQQECAQADWYAMGVTDGSMGRAISQFRSYQADCAEFQLAADFTQYQQGHQQGIKQYCNYDNGLALGKSGQGYNSLCVDALEGQFRVGYDQGRQWYQAEQKIRDVERDIAKLTKQREKLEKTIKDNEAKIIAADSTEQLRKALLTENKGLRDKVEECNVELLRLDELLHRAEQELRRIQG